MSDTQESSVDVRSYMSKTAKFSIEEVFWGYQVRSNMSPDMRVVVAQVLSYFLGACFLTAAAGILLMPVLMFDGEIGVIRVGAAVLFAAVATYLLWYASRGTKPELHVDTSVGEIREVICNRTGKPTTVAVYGFDSIAGVNIEESPSSDGAVLVLQYRTTDQAIRVAEGTEAQLISLRDRLAQDLLVSPRSAA